MRKPWGFVDVDVVSKTGISRLFHGWDVLFRKSLMIIPMIGHHGISMVRIIMMGNNLPFLLRFPMDQKVSGFDTCDGLSWFRGR